LILGSLQLLLWLIFRPSAFRNHLQRIDPDLETDSSVLLFVIQQGGWRQFAVWRLLLQGYIILPILANLTLGLVLWALGSPIERVASGVASGVVWGAASGVVSGVIWGVPSGVASGMVWGMVWGVPSGMASGMVWGMVWGVVLGVAWSVVWGMVSGVASVVVWGVASVMGLGVVSVVGLGVGVTINLWFPVVLFSFLILWNILLYQLEQQVTGNKFSLLRWHSAFWDEWQRLPLIGLDKHLLLVTERNPVEGKAALEYLLTISRQRWAVQAVLIELDARSLERCANVEAIRNVHRSLQYDELESPVSTLLNIFSRISQDVDAALNQQSSYNQRLALRAVVDRLDAQLQNLTRTSNKYAPRFRPIAKSWCQIIAKYIEELAKATELRQEIDSPYIIGVPLTLEQEIFTGRNDIGTRIEQLILDRRRPPLLLYGQRRMGKTSLLNNLGKLLPNSIIPLFVDLQGAPSSASNDAGFLYNLARGMITSAKKQSALTLPSLTREDLEKDPFTCFDEWLDKVEEALQDNTALLSLDEFEVLDSAISKGRFDEQDVFGMLRNLIQHRPKFKILIAGSHTIEEYQRWASYLINVQVVHISYLKEDEARQLIECPVKDFTLRYEPDAVERVLQLTRCHPFLVQLLCGEIVALKNEQDPSVRRLATLADVEAAVPEALSHGSLFFADIQNNQIDAAGLAILRFLAAQGEGAVVSRSTMLQQLADVSESAFELLLQRELIEEVGEGYRFQVELIRRWFVQ
jgi:AAA+ ATPase superfamily predicted ATPase